MGGTSSLHLSIERLYYRRCKQALMIRSQIWEAPHSAQYSKHMNPEYSRTSFCKDITGLL